MVICFIVECNVSYYGVGIEKNLDEVFNIEYLLMFYIVEKDDYVFLEI